MVGVSSNQQSERFRRRLYLPTYRVGDAARYARTAAQSVTYWHYGGGGLGATLPGSHQRRRPLSYMELVEVAFVAFFRSIGVSLQRIRNARIYAAQNLNAEYPFIEYRWQSEGFHLLMDFAQFKDTDDFKVIIADRGGQLGWKDMMLEKFAEFDYDSIGDDHWALRWHPAGRQSKVLIDPRISFGAPIVEGLPTWVLKGRWNAKEDVDEMTEEFGISREAVVQGLQFEGVENAA